MLGDQSFIEGSLILVGTYAETNCKKKKFFFLLLELEVHVKRCQTTSWSRSYPFWFLRYGCLKVASKIAIFSFKNSKWLPGTHLKGDEKIFFAKSHPLGCTFILLGQIFFEKKLCGLHIEVFIDKHS